MLELCKLMVTDRLKDTITTIGSPMPASVATDQTSGAFTEVLAAWEGPQL